jgi:hypothetical protein
MFGISKDKRMNERFLPNLIGESNGIRISFANFPIKVSDHSPRQRIEFCRDFHELLIAAICEEIPDFEIFMAQAIIEQVPFKLKVPGVPPVVLFIQILERKSKEMFTNDLGEALANAIRKENIRSEQSPMP